MKVLLQVTKAQETTSRMSTVMSSITEHTASADWKSTFGNGNDSNVENQIDQFGERGYSKLIAIVISMMTCLSVASLFVYIWLQWYRHRKRRKVPRPNRDAEDAGEGYKMKEYQQNAAAEVGLEDIRKKAGDQNGGDAVHLLIGMLPYVLLFQT